MTETNEVAVKYGIKETDDVVIAGMMLTVLLIKVLKDGFQVAKDFTTVFNELRNNEDFRDAMADAYKDVGMVPKEMGDIDSTEIVQLAGTMLKRLPDVLNALRGQPE